MTKRKRYFIVKIDTINAAFGESQEQAQCAVSGMLRDVAGVCAECDMHDDRLLGIRDEDGNRVGHAEWTNRW